MFVNVEKGGRARWRRRRRRKRRRRRRSIFSSHFYHHRSLGGRRIKSTFPPKPLLLILTYPISFIIFTALPTATHTGVN